LTAAIEAWFSHAMTTTLNQNGSVSLWLYDQLKTILPSKESAMMISEALAPALAKLINDERACERADIQLQSGPG
jgi:hypothetical protein